MPATLLLGPGGYSYLFSLDPGISDNCGKETPANPGWEVGLVEPKEVI